MAAIWNRVTKALGAVMLAFALAACLPGLNGAEKSGGKAGESNILTGDAIESTPLDAPPAAAPASAAAAKPATANEKTTPAATGTASADATAKPPDAAAPGEAASNGASPAADETASDVPPTPEPAAEPVIKSEAWLACEKSKGIWSNAGPGMFSCVHQMKDGGKHCTKSTQCKGQCLARSGTCSPFQPLFGCNEILDDMGRKMTQCLQ